MVQAHEMEAAVQRITTPLLTMAPLALRSTKQSLNEIAAGLYAEPVLRERSRASVHTDDFAEGRAAFAQRRPPVFKGQ